MIDSVPLLLLLGPPGHGVTVYGADIAASVVARDGHARVVYASDIGEAERAAAGSARTHLHVTDRLLGSSPEEAAAVLARLAAGTRLTITAHDLPQQSDGRMRERRAAAYSSMWASVEGVVVNSAHERALVREHLDVDVEPEVIPLGARVAAAPDARPGGPDDVADLVVMVAGFVYPGKGHSQAIDAAAIAAGSLRADGESIGEVVVRAIGGASAGHERDLEDLHAQARRRGVRFEVTGFLDDDAFAAAMGGSGIPLAAHEHVSASRSMLDWVERGRRPLVVDSRYAAEMDALRPRSMTRYRPEELAARVADAWRDPARTWLPAGADLRPSLDDAAEQYVRWWRARDAP